MTLSRRLLLAAALALVITGAIARPVAATVVAAEPAAATTCTQVWTPAARAFYLDRTGRPSETAPPLPPAPSPDHLPFHVTCGSRYVSTVWWNPADPADTPRVVAELVGHARWPGIEIGFNPAVGLVGLPTSWWAVPDPGPVRMLPGDGPRAVLELWAGSVRWRFDATRGGGRTGIGAPWPAHSDITSRPWTVGRERAEVHYDLTGTAELEGSAFPLCASLVRLVDHDVVEVRSLLTLR